MGLFNDQTNRIITAYDINGNPHERNLKNFRFRVSVYGILRDGDKILVAKNPESNKYGFPGGGIEIGETTKEALKREFKEETGLDISVKQLLEVKENFFTYDDQDAHNLIIIYSVEKTGGTIKSDGNEDDTVSVEYMKRDALINGNIQYIFQHAVSNLNI